MNMNNTTTQRLTYFLVTLVLGVAIMGFNQQDERDPFQAQNDLKYEGTYGLYIEKTDHFNIRWITESEDTGQYEVVNQNKKVVASGQTALSRTHRVDLEKKIKGPFTLRFGGKNEGMHEVHVRAQFYHNKTAYSKVDSLYVIGDIHGRYDQLITLLTKSKIIDQNLNWTAGTSHVVFLGDIFDRGDDVTKVLWFIHALEEKAEAAGGKAHLVLGNHEIMTMTKDLRYLSRKEQNIAVAHGLSYDELFHPINSYLGSWLISKVSLLKIDNIVLAHGGILDLGPMTLDEFNEKAYYYMKQPMYLDIMKEFADSTKYDPDGWMRMKFFFYKSDNPYWYRGYVNSDTLETQLNTMLKKHSAKIHIVAHTPLETITQRYDGKLLTTDLKEASTELLLMVRNRKKYTSYKIDSEGTKTELLQDGIN